MPGQGFLKQYYMNIITKRPQSKLGYEFVEPRYLPQGKDEYYLRDLQHGSTRKYRNLTAQEIEILVRNNNSSDNWNHILVAEQFSGQLVRNCHFFGKIRIGKLEPYYLEFHNLRLTVGLYNSTICSCDIGDNSVIENVAYLSHYIIGNEVIITNVNEMTTTDYAKFGNGILKDGEDETVRIWLELRNENAGRRVLPFAGMLPGDAWLWTTFREDHNLMEKFSLFTSRLQDHRRGYYGMVGDRTVIKSCHIIKDTLIGSDAYLKGANKIKNLTIHSNPGAMSQIGEGCELVNGIMGYGCRVFYGVKAVRFVMASHSSLKYGARLINSYLGDNSTVSCCEVLNSLIFPGHEQHHNNSFLCAALIMGQSNMAAGATIGSNHNSRGADGEIIAGRGFWPGLCVSLKHNSQFACFTLIAKGNYPGEINLRIPFSLLVHEESINRLRILPGFWFLYNLYALERNCWKHADRDKREDRTQLIEYEYLAPDSVEEMFEGLRIMEYAVGLSRMEQEGRAEKLSEERYRALGKELLDTSPAEVASLQIHCPGIENSSRPTELIKVHLAYPVFREMIRFYGIQLLVKYLSNHPDLSFSGLMNLLKGSTREPWLNVGGQLMPARQVDSLKSKINKNRIRNWEGLHNQYREAAVQYPLLKLRHGFASLLDIEGLESKSFTVQAFARLAGKTMQTIDWIVRQIHQSREKDYRNPFRKMVYENQDRMDIVLGTLDQNSFLIQTQNKYNGYKKDISRLMKRLK